MTIAGKILIAIGLVSTAFGMVGLFRFRSFYARILITSNIDSAGMIVMMIGGMLHSPTPAFALKIGIIAALALITGPLSTHAILRSARISGYKLKLGERV
jgi:multicomponent Na+:H+ antiporter subunit G